MWNRTLLKVKLKATLIHLGIGSVFLVPLLYLVCFQWFPGPFFHTDGGWQGIRLILLVDMVLGPALTFLIFDNAKTRRALAIDFSFIGLAQAVALVYGVYTVQSTQIWVVAYATEGIYSDNFVAVEKARFRGQQLSADDWKALGDGPQYWVYVRPAEPQERQAVLQSAEQGVPAEALHFLHQPLQQHLGRVMSRALDMESIVSVRPQLEPDYRRFVARHADVPGGLHFFRLLGFYRSVVIALDGEGRYVGFINSDIR